MSGYLYKGTDINTITTGGTATNNFYKGFPTTQTNLNMYKPNSFGYIDPSGDMANRCTAAHTFITNTGTSNIQVPSGCNYFRYIMLGGGGGGGGNGGGAEVNTNVSGSNFTSNAQGGSGAPGGNAIYVYSSNDQKVNSNTVTITIGTGGSGGTNGNKTNNNVNNTNGKGSATGNNGTSGITGNSTIITHGNYVFKTDNYNGLGGGSGNGGYAFLTNADNKSGNNAGNTNSPTTATPSTQGINNNTGGTIGSGYGLGGGINVAGTNGAACIIWLYN